VFGVDITTVGGGVGYPLLFGLVLGESAGAPIPGESSIMVAAIAASQGSLALWAVLATAIAAAILGDNLGYLGGRTVGSRVWTAGRFARERRRRWRAETEAFFTDHGRMAVVVARWLPVARFTVAWLAGINGMPWRQFFVWNAVGGVGWVLTVGVAAYAVGQMAQSAITALGFVGLAGLLVGLGGHAAWRHRSSRPRSGRRGSRRPARHRL
jgi:membrane protein DedA with SNARE-associated domain